MLDVSELLLPFLRALLEMVRQNCVFIKFGSDDLARDCVFRVRFFLRSGRSRRSPNRSHRILLCMNALEIVTLRTVRGALLFLYSTREYLLTLIQNLGAPVDIAVTILVRSFAVPPVKRTDPLTSPIHSLPS